MNAPLPPERIRELLGGYATGTLTPAERAALMRAALEDQALFDQLIEEEALRETLADGAFRAELLQALQPRPRWWRTPWPWAALASATAAAALFVLLRPQPQPPLRTAAGPAAMEVTVNLAKPEPAPSALAAPRTLQIQEQAGRPAQARLETPEQKPVELTEDGAVGRAAAGRPAQAPAESPLLKTAERKDAGAPGPVAAEGLVVLVPSPQREERAAPAAFAPPVQLAAADALKPDRGPGGAAPDIEIASQQPDGAWTPAAPGASLPAGRPLRLRITSPVTATLLLEPRLAAPLAVKAGAPAEWLLPAQDRGELVLRISLAAPAPAAARIQIMERAKARAGSAAAESAAPGAAADRPAPFPREIRIRIE